MQFELDTHTHTIASAHAYSTIQEMAQAAAGKGLKLLAITDHAPSLPDSSPKLHFMGYHVLPKELYGVQMMYGVELNIMDSNGTVDLEEDILKRQDLCIASYHTMCTPAGTKEENTNAYLRVMENPYVNIIGHPEDGYIPVDFEALVEQAKKQHILLEVNNSSLKAAFYRLNTHENMLTMLGLCRKLEVPVSIGSDAHFSGAVGAFPEAEKVLREADMPERLIANTDVKKFCRFLEIRKEMREA